MADIATTSAKPALSLSVLAMSWIKTINFKFLIDDVDVLVLELELHRLPEALYLDQLFKLEVAQYINWVSLSPHHNQIARSNFAPLLVEVKM